MKRLLLILSVMTLYAGSYSQAFAQKSGKESKKIREFTSIINISNSQKKSISEALSLKNEKLGLFDGTVTSKEDAFRKYEIDKECHEKLISHLTDKQIADYCNVVFAPEVSAKTEYRMSLLKEVDNEYTDDELVNAWNSIYKYLMLEKIVYFKYKYDYAKQKENISRLKALQPSALKASINNEKQKGYDKVISGKVKWNKGNSNKGKKK